MRKNRLAILCLAFLAGFVNPSTATEVKKAVCNGKVVGSGGEPIAGAKVGLYKMPLSMDVFALKADLAQQTTTKDDGTFTLETDVATDNLILVEKEGLAIGWANWNLSEEIIDVRIILGEAKVLAGKVIDEYGNGIAEAEVSIQFMAVPSGRYAHYLFGEISRQLFTSTTDVEGKFSFERIPADATAEFLVKKPGRVTVNTYDPSSGLKLQFAPGQDNIKLVMPVEAKIEGTAVEKGGDKPVSGVKIMVLREQKQPGLKQEPIVSKEDGTFSINALPSGKLFLQIVPLIEGLADWVAEPVEVTTEAGKTISGVKVEVVKGGLLEVVITEAEGEKPLERAEVRIYQQSRNQWLNARSDKEGIARMRLLPGEYLIGGVHKEGYTQEERQETVSIEDGKTARIKWQLVGQPKIVGVVREEAGKPVGDVTIRFLPGGGTDFKTDDEGRFEVAWNPRWWRSDETVRCVVARDERRNLAAVAEIEKETKPLDIKIMPGVIFGGSVVDPNDKSIARAQVIILLRTSSWSVGIRRDEVETDARGNFEVKAIPPGQRYYVIARADGYGEKQIEADADDAVGGRLRVEKLILPVANLSVSGVVVDANDKPIAGARVYCYSEGQQQRGTQTDAEGKFTLDKICPGKVNVLAWGKGQLNGSVQTEGGARDVKIVISAEERGESRFVPKQPPSLAGKALPEFKEFGIELSPADVNDRMILLCFWDMNQRPSRNCIMQLAKQAEQLKEKGVTIVAIQSAKIDQTALNEWIKKYNIPFAVGMVTGDEEKIRFEWGVKSLPWLILTDREHIVRAEAFGLAELDEKIKAITQK